MMTDEQTIQEEAERMADVDKWPYNPVLPVKKPVNSTWPLSSARDDLRIGVLVFDDESGRFILHRDKNIFGTAEPNNGAQDYGKSDYFATAIDVVRAGWIGD